jgi:hypothetical protein
MSIVARLIHDGREARISQDYLLETLAVGLPFSAFSGLVKQNTFSVSIIDFSGGSSGTVFFTGSTIDPRALDVVLMLVSIEMVASSSGELTVNEATGTAAGGTVVESRNNFIGSSRVSNANWESGAPITGLTLTPIRQFSVVTGESFVRDLTNYPLFLGRNRRLAFTYSRNNPTISLSLTFAEINDGAL